MAKIKPFKALRFTKKAGDIASLCCPPYDIISDAEQNALYDKSPYNIIRLELNRDAERYASAAHTLVEWMDAGILKKDEADAIYIYEEEFSFEKNKYKLRTFISLIELTPFEDGIVLPHEETLSKAKADRFELMRSTFCNFSQIYSLYNDENKDVEAILDDECKRKPDVMFTASDGVIQRLWIMTDKDKTAKICRAFTDKQVYIADGHHRYETAINFRNELREKGVICTDADHPVNYAMMAFVDIMNPGLVVLPTHRLIKDLPDYSKEDVREKLRGDFDIIEDIEVSKLQESLRAEDEGKRFAYYSGGGRFDLLTLKNTEAPKKRMPDKDESYINLDVAVLHSVILEPVFAIDKKNMAQQKNLSYTRSVDEAIKGVDYGKYQCAFIVNPTKVSQIRDVAAAGEKMPQKSTYFHPKLITGLVMNKITD